MDEKDKSDTTSLATATPVAVAAHAVSDEEFNALLRKLDMALKSRTDAFRDSERLSEEDFAIRINARA